MDTDICIEILRGNKKVITKRSHISDEISVSFMTVGKLLYGAYNSTKIENNVSIVEEFLLSVKIINSDFYIMKRFGLLKTELKKENILLPDADLIIAATAVTKCDLLVSGNTKHFERIKELKLVNWVR